MLFALAGNQNCGKTTLFNRLTGSNQHVGNFPGVTVDSKSGTVKNHSDCTVADLPGIYSIRPYTSEEFVARDFIFNQNPDCIINIVDATNIERNLYLTLQLITLRIPMVLALNMIDEIRGNGGSIDAHEMSELLGIPVIPISAAENEGIDELIETSVECAKSKILPKVYDFCNFGPVCECIHKISNLIENHSENINISKTFTATKIIENDFDIIKKLNLGEHELKTIEQSISKMENETGLDRYACIADMRYSFIEKICAKTVKKPAISKEYIRSAKIDSWLTGKYLAVPLFFVIIIFVFYLTFNVIGKFLSNVLSYGIDRVTSLADALLTNHNVNPTVHSLIIDGIFSGVGSVLSFLPIVVTLFFFLSILEDTGYMARIAFIMDKPLRKIGLSGKSFVPMLIGFGCSVPAIMASRTLSSGRDRKMTILLIPYMSCSAKIPIYAVFASAFFPSHPALVMSGLYFFGIAAGITVACILNKTVFRGKPVPFVMELPNYRFPSFKSVMLLMRDKARDFLQRAFSVIFIATVIIWFLENFDKNFNLTHDNSLSLLAAAGKFISPIFAPLGFSDWKTATSLVAGFTAKEAVISTLAVLTGTSISKLSGSLCSLFTPISAISFLIFTLLYTPCIAAVSVIKKELSSGLAALGVVFMQCAAALIFSFATYNILCLFC